MARPRRRDAPNTFHHITNRGVAKRSLFEDDRDIEFFLARLIRQHDYGRIGILNYCCLTTHFHLLLHSPCGALSEAMRRVQSEYTLRFNSRRDRDGAVLKGRFWSSLIDSDAYMIAAMRYIDANAVDAGLVSMPEEYPWGAMRYRAGGDPPEWLDRTELDRFIREQTPAFSEPRASYLTLFGGSPSASEADWVERRLLRPEGQPGLAELDDLVGSAPERFQAWLLERTSLADGTVPGAPGASPLAVEARVAEERGRVGAWEVGEGQRRRCAWRLLAAGLMRHLCGLPWKEIEQRLGERPSTLKRIVEEHAAMAENDDRYGWVAGRIGRAALMESCGAQGGRPAADLGAKGRTRRGKRALAALRGDGGEPIGGFRSDPM